MNQDHRTHTAGGNLLLLFMLWLFITVTFLTHLTRLERWPVLYLAGACLLLLILTMVTYKHKDSESIKYFLMAGSWGYLFAGAYTHPSFLLFVVCLTLPLLASFYQNVRFLIANGILSITFIFYSYPNTAEAIQSASVPELLAYLIIFILLMVSLLSIHLHRTFTWKNKAIYQAVNSNRSEEGYRTLIEMSPDPIVVHHHNKIVFVNKAGRERLGAFSTEEILGRDIMEFVHPDSFEKALKRAKAAYHINHRLPIIEEHFVGLDGREIYGEVATGFVWFEQQPCIQVIIRDITERKYIQTELERSNKRLHTILESITDGFFHLNNQWEFTYINDEAASFLDSDTSLIGERIDRLPLALENKQINKYFFKARDDQEVQVFELRFHGHSRWFNIRIYPSKEGMSVYFTDITEQKNSEARLIYEKEQLETLSRLDRLTNIGNRYLFDVTLEDYWFSWEKNERSFALFMIDIDYFKEYNDYYGHVSGDNCLKLVSSRICEWAVELGGSGYRYGGEEFAVLLPITPETPGSTALQQGEKLRREIERLQISHHDSPIHSSVTISVGASSSDSAAVNNSEQMLNSADKALYLSKKNGKNMFIHM
ncbi:diguanylate cyclase domain-containing protein [Alteribacillus sp. HJP-4]|uniref:sensor domain-containing diguanylate cyclase n=1 Tax=Alteribacillus sp. HJP-4 TaxID=2775394 RepID=UPI0035CD0A8B